MIPDDERADDAEGARGRRAYLGALGAAAASVAGCLGSGSDDPRDRGSDAPANGTDSGDETDGDEIDVDGLDDRHGIAFDRVLNAVDDLGLDPAGETAANEDLETALSTSGTLVTFPEGTYRFEDTVGLESERIGVLGLGGVAFVPDFGFSDLLFDGQGVTLDNVLVENVDIDIRAPATTTGIRLNCRNRFHVENVEYVGRGTNGSPGGTTSAFLLAIRAEDGRGVLRNVVAKKGSRIDGYEGGNGRIGVWVGWTNKGTVRIEGCDFREFGNNGVYGSRTPGQVEIVDSYFLNNNVCGPRIGGAGSYVENCTVEIDLDRYTGGAVDTTTEFNTRAIVVEQGIQRAGSPPIEAGAEIRGCTLRALSSPRSQSVVEQSPVARSLTVRDTEIRCDIDGTSAVRRGPVGSLPYRPDRGRPPLPHWTRLENVSVGGSAAGGVAVDLRLAPESRVTDCEITCRGADRDGVLLDLSPRSEVTGSSIRTDGHPIVVDADATATGDSLLCLGLETVLERFDEDGDAGGLTADPSLLRTLVRSDGRVCFGLGSAAFGDSSDPDSLRFGIDALDDGVPVGRFLNRS
ncbi:right-handed parallel beta-helix repeat-containing protein [Halorubrum sp. T3]|uniref:right-handed parallel beta-helix repeat-containing protein n=1 Tax=Halorubrum sp. T3 TaxID=1194088 RepID=UPI000368E044|nr:right-handed parallel beta-helix repeat-containing protein [Halorubrum sp. T3]